MENFRQRRGETGGKVSRREKRDGGTEGEREKGRGKRERRGK